MESNHLSSKHLDPSISISISIWRVQSWPQRLRLRLNGIEKIDEIEISISCQFQSEIEIE